jgi:hypothetical protein
MFQTKYGATNEVDILFLFLQCGIVNIMFIIYWDGLHEYVYKKYAFLCYAGHFSILLKHSFLAL